MSTLKPQTQADRQPENIIEMDVISAGQIRNPIFNKRTEERQYGDFSTPKTIPVETRCIIRNDVGNFLIILRIVVELLISDTQPYIRPHKAQLRSEEHT